MAKQRILVVEDEWIVAETIRRQLTRRGYQVAAIASQGTEAVELAEESRPDLVLMDIHLIGEMDGIEAAERIRQRLDIPVVFLTAYADETTLQRAKVTGPVGYLVKPVDESALHSAVETALYRDAMERRVRANEARLRDLLNSLAEGVVVAEEERRISFANPEAERLLGWSEEQLRDQPLEQVLLAPDETTPAATREALASDQPRQVEDALFRHRDGFAIPVSFVVSPMRRNGDRAGTIVAFRDIRERKRLEAELAERDRLMLTQARHAAMGEMLAMIAHQWRQPLATVGLVVTNVLADLELGPLNEAELREQLGQIDRLITHLSATIDDFRDFFRPSGEREAVRVERVADQALTLMAKILERHGIEVVRRYTAGEPLPAFGNELMQLLLGLLQNAVEVLVERGVNAPRITVASLDRGEAVVLEVTDNGGGIVEGARERLFDPYFTTKQASGSGLGLYMAKLIVEKHHRGTLVGENIEGGARFTVTLPRHAGDPGG